MQAKLIAFGIILVLILTTVILQMAVFGNDEEMAEEEYEEYQIRIDFNQMAKGFLSLFDSNVKLSKKHDNAQEDQESRQTSDDNSALTLQVMPTAQTLPTLVPFGEGTKDDKDAE